MIEIAEFPDRIVLGLSGEFIAASHENSNAPEVIGALWGDMSWRYFSMNLDRDAFPLGIGAMWFKDSNQAGEMIYFAGYEVKTPPTDLGELELLEIPGGKYAYYTHEGPLSNFSKSNNYFYSELFPNSGLTRRMGMALEIYSEVDESGSPTKTLIAVPVN